jgi:hypothetical protein
VLQNHSPSFLPSKNIFFFIFFCFTVQTFKHV